MKNWLSSALWIALSGAMLPAQGVRISEVNYHPEFGEAYEYVELLNAGPAAVELQGWSFTAGIGFAFAEPLTVAPGSVIVLAHNRAAVAGAYLVNDSLIAGEFSGSLDNDGERIALVDGDGRLMDELSFADSFPFDSAADGAGAALERICFDLPGDAPFNWRAASPSPGRHEGQRQCPPAPPAPDVVAHPVVIHEIQYHPAGDKEPPLEFVELYNRGGSTQDLGGWQFDRGISFTFPEGASLPQGGFVLVAQDPAMAVSKLSLDASKVFGPFANGSKLSNSGERIRLVDASGSPQDEVAYGQDGAWPALADGLGASLQRVDPMGPSSSPGNWRAAPPPADGPVGGEWHTLQAVGPHDGPRVYLYLLGTGDMLVDDIRLEVQGGDGTNLITNGDFSAEFTGWLGTGNHVASHAEPAGGFGDDGPCGLIHATGPGNGFQHAIRQTLPVVPPRGATCILSLRAKSLGGESKFVARSSIATSENGLLYLEGDASTGESTGTLATPLKANHVGAGPAAPALEFLDASPSWPGSKDPVLVRLRVIAQDVMAASARYSVGTSPEKDVALSDDGQNGDATASDGVWSGFIPPAPNGSLVWISFTAKASSGATAEWPPYKNPVTVTGYYVQDSVPAQNEDLRLFYMFTPGALRDLSCSDGAYVQGDFVDFRGRAYRGVGVKHRGETACSYPKRPIRVKFQKGDLFDDQKHLNFNAGWNDKSMLREQFGFDFFRDASCGYSETHMARVHTNGNAFNGVYFTIEDPSEEYLRRNRRNLDGGFFKCRTAMLSGSTSGYEPRTDGSPADLPAVGEFATQMNARSGQALIDFLTANMDVEAMFDYQAVQVIIIDGDSVVKNWLLYHGRHDLEVSGPALFTQFPWDLDLSYGQMLLTTDVRNYDIHPLFQTQTYPFYDQGYHGMLNALLQRPPNDYFVKAFYGRMWRLLEEKFNEETLFPKLDRIDANTHDAAREDLRLWPRSWGARGTDLDYWRKDFRTFISRRSAYLKAYLTALNPTTQGRKLKYAPLPRVKFTEIHYNPALGRDDLEFVELTSLEDSPVSIGGWQIPLLAFEFEATAEIPAHGTVLLARDPGALRKEYGLADAVIFGPYASKLPGDGAVLRLRDSGEAGKYFPETIDVVVYEDRKSWPRAADGEGKSLELATLTSDNDYGANWRAGWSPGKASAANSAPAAVIAASTSSGTAPLRVFLNASGSLDPDGDDLTIRWSFSGPTPLTEDGRTALVHTFEQTGTYIVRLDVTDPFGSTGSAELVVTVSEPGEPSFRRGDSNSDGKTDLSDAIHSLRFLFLGDAAPQCPDAGDSDDDGTLAITDAIYTLGFLFISGAPPPLPGPVDCGADPTADELETCVPMSQCSR